MPNSALKNRALPYCNLNKTFPSINLRPWFCNYSYPKLESWKEGSNCCSWDGVVCDKETGQVIELDLSCSRLQGTIPPNSSLFHFFPHLQRLDLSYNHFVKSCISPAVSQLTKLTYLNLSSSGFSGKVPIEVSFLTQLVSLDLSSNDLRLEIPGFELLVRNLTKIRELNFGDVNISSMVPNSMLNLTSLTNLDVRMCGLHGKFPNGIFQLPHLKKLDIWGNEALTGYFPKFINSSSPLQYLYLLGTSFSGELPGSIGNLKSLKELDASYCKFFGSIPTSLGNLTQITWLMLPSNNFDGMLPSSLANLKNLIGLNLANNEFTGPFTLLDVNLTNLRSLDVSNNSLTGHLPPQVNVHPNMYFLNIGQNLINGTIPSWVFSLRALKFIDLSHNKLIGNIDEFQSASLWNINLSNNLLHGIVPSSTFELVDLVNLILSSNNFSGTILESIIFRKHLFVLDLQKNNFTGTIHDSFPRGNFLRIINLNDNRFEGPIPKSLVNCSHLEVLDLGGNKFSDEFPHWLENLPNLQVLILRSNRLQGPIITSKTKLPFPELRVIDMSSNSFTGQLPKEYFEKFGAMKNIDEANFELQYMWTGRYYQFSLDLPMKGSIFNMGKVLTIFVAIDLSRNKFEGEIPEIIGSLNSIRGLNLSHNSLTGHIPTSLGNLIKLEWLDLSSNKLTGVIPEQLLNLGSLSVLKLSHNQLSGPIPQGKQFDTFSNDSYIGNLALCGRPLSNTCSNPGVSQLPPTMFEEDDSEFLSGFSWEVVLPGYGFGLVVGLVMGYLMLSAGKPWWLVRIIDSGGNKSGKRLKKHSWRRRGRRN
ncbi:receptor-like protein 9DC3 [Actinidia eriantha]|uniref:receptor-like protein 9DC3 n=1 Tax=Actinidia eriantha TaxID=165200 RepID=UPI0025858042|nr:receptor-like protein 9DC3 [Actinidia eriantha]XP_057486287.1 receptor-like protein 9DC3 [Actinidia eriantha]XP_057486288.1 receptor-like protein 9DC3 [Actinidia eriantha]